MSSDRPIIFYIDDEPRNLTIFEADLDDQWEILTFDNPLKALEALETHSPAVILTDQRMPEITGVRFLELARKINEDAVRIVVTGYSDENLIIESVRKAQVFDYITKPWDSEDLEASIQRAIHHFNIHQENKRLLTDLKKINDEMESKNRELVRQKEELRELAEKEEQFRKELQCWVPPFILWSINNESVRFPLKRNLVGIAFDIIESSKIHDVQIQGQPVRTHIIRLFSECVLRHGGWRESHSGDSAYGHFGLFEDEVNPCDSALAAAREFRVALRGLAEKSSVPVECGISLHICTDCNVDVHTVTLNTPRGTVVQKSFDTTSVDVDILHRMEKLVHRLPGSNIIMSKEFVDELNHPPVNITPLGRTSFSENSPPTEMSLITSDLAKEEDLTLLRDSLESDDDLKMAA